MGLGKSQGEKAECQQVSTTAWTSHAEETLRQLFLIQLRLEQWAQPARRRAVGCVQVHAWLKG